MFRLSIVVPIYNTEKYLVECIESITKQLKSDVQIVLIDDGSTDGSGEICDYYYHKYPNQIKAIHKPNAGLVAARKTGIEGSDGEYIGFVDSDDWVSDKYIETILNVLDKFHVDLITFDYINIKDGDCSQYCQPFKAGYYNAKNIQDDIMPYALFDNRRYFYHYGIAPAIWCKVMKRNILKKIQEKIPEQITIGEDAAIIFPYLGECSGLYHCGECLYYYRYVATSMVRTFKPNYFEKIEIENEYLLSECNRILKDQIEVHYLSMLIKGLKANSKSGKSIVDAYYINKRQLKLWKTKKYRDVRFNGKDKLILFLINNRAAFILTILFRMFRG